MRLLKELLARIVHSVRHVTRDQPSEQNVVDQQLNIEEVEATITVSYDKDSLHSRKIYFDPAPEAFDSSAAVVAHPYPVGTHRGSVLVDHTSGKVVGISTL